MKVFKEKQWFDFEKLTLLTGTNNSGKSSVISAMQLLQQNIKAKDMQDLLETKIKVATNQKKHGSLFNFVNNKSEDDKANHIAFHLQKGNIIYALVVEVKQGLQSHGVVKAILATDKKSKEKIFTLIPIDLENQFECNFQINYKYFLNKFYQKCENTIKLRERSAELDELVKLVREDTADIAELRKLADDLSEEFSVYINIDYMHYTDPNFDLIKGISFEDDEVKEVRRGNKGSKISEVNYSIDKNDRFGVSPNQDIAELGVFFNEGSLHEIGKNSVPLKSEPSLFSKEEIDAIYTNTTKHGIFDFSFLWQDNKYLKDSFEKLICTHYQSDFKTANRKLCDDLILVSSNLSWNMKEIYSNMAVELVPHNLLQLYIESLPYFGVIERMVTYGENKSFIKNKNINAQFKLDIENEDIIRLNEEGFFENVYNELSSWFFNFIKQQDIESPEIDGTMSFEQKQGVRKQQYSIFKPDQPIIHLKPFNIIFNDIIRKTLDVNLCFSNEYISSNRFAVQRYYSFNDQTDFSKLLEKVEKLEGDERKACNEFITKWIKRFGIADDLILEPDSDTGNFKAYLKKDDIETSLSDFGLGTNQLLPVIFALAIHKENSFWSFSLSKDKFENRTVVLEEPEANLHPALQSKLADMFVDAIKTFNVQIIAETHSEYLIRRLQYLTAKNLFEPKSKSAISPEDSVIYYFNQDKYVNKKDPKVVKIEITENGNLTDTFGKGFFDEATTLKFDLIRLSKNQFN